MSDHRVPQVCANSEARRSAIFDGEESAALSISFFVCLCDLSLKKKKKNDDDDDDDDVVVVVVVVADFDSK